MEQTKNDKKACALDRIMIEYMLLADEHRPYTYLFDEMEKSWDELYNPTGIANASSCDSSDGCVKNNAN